MTYLVIELNGAVIVFVGADCTFLPNTFVGNNCIIGAGSVVRGRFPDNSVIVGNPAKVLAISEGPEITI